eukprot:gene5270-18507_t
MVALTYIASHVSLVVSEASVPCASVLSLFLSVLPGPLYTFACSPSGDSAHMKHEPSLCCHQPYQPEAITTDVQPEAITTDVQPEVITTDVQLEAITTDVQPEAVTTDVQPEAVTTDVQPEAVTTDVQPEAVTTDVQPEAITSDISIHRTFDLSHRAGDVPDSTADLAPHLGDLSHRTGDLAPHPSDLSHHTGDLAPHPPDLSHRTGDVPDSTADLAPHLGNPSHRAGDLADHTADLATRALDLLGRELMDETADTSSEGGAATSSDSNVTSSNGEDGDTGELVFTASVWGVTLSLAGFELHSTYSSDNIDYNKDLPEIAEAVGLPVDKLTLKGGPLESSSHVYAAAQPRGRLLSSRDEVWNYDTSGGGGGAAPSSRTLSDVIMCPGGPLSQNVYWVTLHFQLSTVITYPEEVQAKLKAWLRLRDPCAGLGSNPGPTVHGFVTKVKCLAAPNATTLYSCERFSSSAAVRGLSLAMCKPVEAAAGTDTVNERSSSSGNLGLILGCVLGGLAFVAITASIAVWAWRRSCYTPVPSDLSSPEEGNVQHCDLWHMDSHISLSAPPAATGVTPVPRKPSWKIRIKGISKGISKTTRLPSANSCTQVKDAPSGFLPIIPASRVGATSSVMSDEESSLRSTLMQSSMLSQGLRITPSSLFDPSERRSSTYSPSASMRTSRASNRSGQRLPPRTEATVRYYPAPHSRFTVQSPSCSGSLPQHRNSRFSQASMRSSLRSSVRSSRGSRNQPLPYTAMEAAMREGSRQARGKIDDDLAELPRVTDSQESRNKIDDELAEEGGRESCNKIDNDLVEATEGSAVSTASPALSRDKLVLSATSVQMARACSSGSPAGSPVLGDRSSPLLGSVDSPLRQPGSSRSASSAVPPALLSVSECSDGGGSFTHSILSRDMSQMSVASKNNSFIPIFSHPSCMSQNELNPQEGIRGPGDALLHQHVVLSQGGTPMAGGSRGAGLSSLANVGLPTSSDNGNDGGLRTGSWWDDWLVTVGILCALGAAAMAMGTDRVLPAGWWDVWLVAVGAPEAATMAMMGVCALVAGGMTGWLPLVSYVHWEQRQWQWGLIVFCLLAGGQLVK